jgi:hypothetical protein
MVLMEQQVLKEWTGLWVQWDFRVLQVQMEQMVLMVQ